VSKKEFPHKAQSRLDLGLLSPSRDKVEKGAKPPAMTPIRLEANDSLKPVAMTPVTGSGEDRGLKPIPMTPTPAPAPAQPVSVPVRPKK